MGVLEQVTKLKNEGMGEDEIIGTLSEQGVSPKEVNDALGQSKIKTAVSHENPRNGEKTNEMEPSIMRPERAEHLPTEGSAPSDSELTPPASTIKIPAAAQRNLGSMTKEFGEEENYVPSPQGQEAPEQDSQQYDQPQGQGTYLQQEYSPQQGYGGYEEEYSVGGGNMGPVGTDTDTMIEIAEQVFSEKMKMLQKQVEDFNEFKILSQTKIDNVSDRLKRIETSIDRLQAAILEKVGSYGRGLDVVKKEMSMMQGSFGKVVNTLADRAQHKHHVSHTPHQTKTLHSTRVVKKPTKKKAVSKRK